MNYNNLVKQLSNMNDEQLSIFANECIKQKVAVPLEHALHEAQLFGDDDED
jgi:hypothetical protein